MSLSSRKEGNEVKGVWSSHPRVKSSQGKANQVKSPTWSRGRGISHHRPDVQFAGGFSFAAKGRIGEEFGDFRTGKGWVRVGVRVRVRVRVRKLSYWQGLGKSWGKG